MSSNHQHCLVWQSVPGDDRILVAVVVELVVAGQSQQGPEARAQRGEDLSGGGNPDLVRQSVSQLRVERRFI